MDELTSPAPGAPASRLPRRGGGLCRTAAACVVAAVTMLCLPSLAQGPPLILGGEGVEVHYWPQDEDLAWFVRDHAQSDLKGLCSALGVTFRGTVLIEIARSHEEFDRLVGERRGPGTLGVSVHGQEHIILQPVTQPELGRLVTHELTHVVLDLKMARSGVEPPRWVHEGVAQWMEGEMRAAEKDVLGRAAAEGRLIRLADLERAFAGKPETVSLAYAESYALIGYMADHGPQGCLARFLELLMETGDEHLALRRAMRLPVGVVERRWLEDTRRRYLARGVPLSVELVIFAVMTLALVAAVVMRRREGDRIRRRMQEEERFEALMLGVDLAGEEDLDDGDVPGPE